MQKKQTRGNFLKTLGILFLSPKILTTLKIKSKSSIPSQGVLISNLQLLTPDFYKSYTEKYGNVDFTEMLKHMGQYSKFESKSFYWYESKSGEVIKRDFTGDPVTININKENRNS